MASCAFSNCGDPECQVCNWEERFPEKAAMLRRMEEERKKKTYTRVGDGQPRRNERTGSTASDQQA